MSILHLLAHQAPYSVPSRLGSDGLANAPIRGLPVEIMVKIFILCIVEPSLSLKEANLAWLVREREMFPLRGDPLGPYLNLPTMPSKRSPLRLCGICRYWRHIVLNTPSLWSNFSLDLTLGPLDLSHRLSELSTEAQV